MPASNWLKLPQLVLEPPDPRKCHHFYGIERGANTYYPEPDLLGDAAGISGLRSSGTAIFDASDVVVLWDLMLFPDTAAANPTLTVHRADTNDPVLLLDGSSNLTSIRIPFPFAVPGGFYVVTTSDATSFQCTWQRYSA